MGERFSKIALYMIEFSALTSQTGSSPVCENSHLASLLGRRNAQDRKRTDIIMIGQAED